MVEVSQKGKGGLWRKGRPLVRLYLIQIVFERHSEDLDLEREWDECLEALLFPTFLCSYSQKH